MPLLPLKRHFTLIEVVISIAIIGTSLMSLLVVRNRAIEDIGLINQARLIRTLAEKKIGEIEIGAEANEVGHFSEEGYPEIRWEVFKENIEIFETGSDPNSEQGKTLLEEAEEEEPASYFLYRITLTLKYGEEYQDQRYDLVVYTEVPEDKAKEENEGQ
jgi:hypothetical protein